MSAVALCGIGCGPTAIGAGIGELAKKDRDTTVLLVIVNNNGEPLAVTVDGGTFRFENVPVGAGQTTRLTLPATGHVRVRGNESLSASTRAAVAWDQDVALGGAGATVALGVESAIVSSNFSKTAGNADADLVDIRRFDGAAVAFSEVGATQLDFEPDKVVLHPSGARLYTLKDLGSGTGEIRAFRIVAEGGAVELIGAELGQDPVNPLGFMFVSSFDFVVDPSGRFAWLLDRNATLMRTILHAYTIAADGSLTETATFTRGFVFSMDVAPNGENAYLSETFGSGHKIRAFRIDRATGAFDFQINEVDTPCTANDSAGPIVRVHPNGKFAYVLTPDSAPSVRVGSYALLAGGSILQTQTCATGFQTLQDLSFSSQGDFLYVTGSNGGGTPGLLRYAIDAQVGTLTLAGTQTFTSALSNLTSGSLAGLPASDPNKHIVFLAKNETLVPTTSGAGGVVAEVKDGQGMTPALPFGGAATTRFTTFARRGTATVTAGAQ